MSAALIPCLPHGLSAPRKSYHLHRNHVLLAQQEGWRLGRRIPAALPRFLLPRSLTYLA